MLYTVDNNLNQKDMATLMHLVRVDDAIVLLQNGVFSALEKDLNLALLIEKGAKIYAIEEDILARGLNKHLSSTVKMINYDEFVALSVAQKQQIAW